MRLLLLAIIGAAAGHGGCGGSGTAPSSDAPIAGNEAPTPDAPPAALYTLAGMCGVLNDPELTGASPLLVKDAMSFSRRYNDPADRPLLTPGAQTIASLPNAGGSSLLSEVFAFEQLARCEQAGFLKAETQIIYDTAGKITDILVTVDGHKIGVSVVRAVQFPFGSPYTVQTATTIIQRKLEDIQLSSMNVSAQDKWVKQILAVMAYDDQHVDMVEQVWLGLAPSIKADTVLVVTATHGDDTFLYTNQ
ncbi:MAG: hypothetical protein H0T65_01040 [Deltaproteobacteria bacterium]|nr:hypothetical protein [Deltaproteobacteria bacterium]